MGGLPPVVNGIVVADKPAGITSYDVVRGFKKMMPGIKIGYLGTLDPLATGVLPILLGEGTKLAPFLEEGTKVYEATLHLGVTTDTQDKEGKILQSVAMSDYDLSPQKVKKVIQRFRGKVMQLPPMYSALKHRGERLYKLARRGEAVERVPREVEIYELQITDLDPPEMSLHIECSKGTYVRTVAHDIGEALGCGAHLTGLRRTRSGPFDIEKALSLGDITVLLSKGKLRERILPLAEAVGFLPAVEVGEDKALQISNGQTVILEDLSQRSEEDERVVRVLTQQGGGLVAVGGVQRDKEGLVLRPLRVFHDALFTKAPPCDRDMIDNRSHTNS